jgi:hypothetical protein
LVGRCQSIFSGPRWQKLARRGGRILRPKWSRTTPRNPAYADTCYIEALICPHTVTTFSLQSLAAFQEHGRVESHTASWAEQAEAHLRRVAELGLDMDTIAANLQQEYLRASEHQFQAITRRISRKREELERAWQRTATHGTAVHPAVMTELPTQNPIVR